MRSGRTTIFASFTGGYLSCGGMKLWVQVLTYFAVLSCGGAVYYHLTLT